MTDPIKIQALPDFDPAEHLRDREDIAAYLTAAMSEPPRPRARAIAVVVSATSSSFLNSYGKTWLYYYGGYVFLSTLGLCVPLPLFFPFLPPLSTGFTLAHLGIFLEFQQVIPFFQGDCQFAFKLAYFVLIVPDRRQQGVCQVFRQGGQCRLDCFIAVVFAVAPAQ